MKEIELSELEIKVLRMVKNTRRRDSIRIELALTYNWTARIFKKFKELGLTKIMGFNDFYEWKPFVMRFTKITTKWEEYLDKTHP